MLVSSRVLQCITLPFARTISFPTDTPQLNKINSVFISLYLMMSLWYGNVHVCTFAIVCSNAAIEEMST